MEQRQFVIYNNGAGSVGRVYGMIQNATTIRVQADVTPMSSPALVRELHISRKATIIFVMSVRLFIPPSVRMEQLGFNFKDFHEIQ